MDLYLKPLPRLRVRGIRAIYEQEVERVKPDLHPAST